MKKFILIIIVLILFLQVFVMCSHASSLDNEADIQAEIYSEISEIIPDDARDVLESSGMENFNLNEIYNISLNKITDFFMVTLKDKVSDISKDFFNLLSAVLIISIITSLFKGYYDEKLTDILSVVIITISSVGVIEGSLGAVVSVLDLSGKFMIGFAPIYTLIISLSGNAASALTYNTVALFIAEIISKIITSGAIDLIGVYFCLGISFSLNETINMGRFTSVINRFVSTALGLLASVFTGYLGLKNILSVSVDRVSVRSIRFLISSVIPIVGSAISDAYSSLIGSINLIKGSVAIVAILVILILNIPIIIENLIYYISFNLLSYVSDILLAKKVGDVFRVFTCGMRILLLLCIFEVFVLIISVGIALSVKGGV